jgi:hypothetical protein
MLQVLKKPAQKNKTDNEKEKDQGQWVAPKLSHPYALSIKIPKELSGLTLLLPPVVYSMHANPLRQCMCLIV